MNLDVKKELSLLFALAKADPSSANVQMIDSSIEAILKDNPDVKAYFKYNEFRISNLTKLPRTRPQILLGGPFEVNFPNFHTLPLLEVADVICIAPSSKPSVSVSTIPSKPSDLLFDILTKLPRGFVPDFYWDNQVEFNHFIPSGIHTAPFPIVASVCHTYLHKSVEYICELFDLVVAMSKQHAQILRKLYPNKIIELPFGLNWGSLDHIIIPCWEKSRDVCLIFWNAEKTVYLGKRREVVQWTEKFKEKYGNRFSITMLDTFIPQEKFLHIIKQSRIVINVVALNGPYNYRTVEIMSSGTMLFQYDWDDPFFNNRFSELFIDGVHGVSFNEDNFEKKLLYYLENPQEAEKIARAGYEFLKENYNYKKLYQELIRIVTNSNVRIPRNFTTHVSYFQADMVYYYQNSQTFEKMAFGAIDLAQQPFWIRCNNLMILISRAKKEEIERLLLLALSEKEISCIKKAEIKQVCLQLLTESLEQAPKELGWIVRWNFLMISLERDIVTQSEIKSLMSLLETTHPEPFDEKTVMFKYYIESSSYPEYKIPSEEYIKLNLALMKDSGDPLKRSSHYLNYAIEALKSFSVRP